MNQITLFWSIRVLSSASLLMRRKDKNLEECNTVLTTEEERLQNDDESDDMMITNTYYKHAAHIDIQKHLLLVVVQITIILKGYTSLALSVGGIPVQEAPPKRIPSLSPQFLQTGGGGGEELTGDWAAAKEALRDSKCCVVSVTGLEAKLEALQAHFAESGPMDLDLRAKVNVPIRGSGSGVDEKRSMVHSSTINDCFRIRRSILTFDGDGNDNYNYNYEEDCFSNSSRSRSNHVDVDVDVDTDVNIDPCTGALIELARGVASLADGPLENKCDNVFLRIVCASNYRAIDPMYHTDKAPLRGYVTLRGVGTEFMERPCSPLEYVALRSLGKGVTDNSIRQAGELEFIVMKGDHYQAPETDGRHSWMIKMWKRATACVHRSPPGAAASGRRVIVSLDLGDGDDNREWYQAGTKREWRSGMTQRKSRLVS